MKSDISVEAFSKEFAFPLCQQSNVKDHQWKGQTHTNILTFSSFLVQVTLTFLCTKNEQRRKKLCKYNR